VYHYRLAGLIEGVLVEGNTLLQYQNVRNSRATGVEAELRGRPVSWLETVGGVTVQKSSYVGGDRLPNSPRTVLQFRASTPLFRERLNLSVAARHLSARATPYDWSIQPVTLTDFTATTAKLHPQFDLQFGVRNLFDQKYSDPMSEEHSIQSLARAGRSVFFRVLWRIPE
jgi:outer membrane receptor protein involved in Fe transport